MQDDVGGKDSSNRATPRRQRRKGWVLWPTVFVVVVLLLGPIVLLAMSGRPIGAPDWVRTRIEATAGQSLAGGSISLGDISLVLTDFWEPHVRIAGASVADQTGLPIAEFDSIEVTLSRPALLRAQILPVAVNVQGAALSLRRDPAGHFDLSLQAQGASGQAGSFADVIDSVERVFETPALASISTVRAQEVVFQYEDVRAERFWVARGGALELDQSDQELDLRIGFELLYQEETPPAQVALSFQTEKNSPRATLAANVRGLPASDFSTQAPAFAFLSTIKAPLSGAVRAEFGEDGKLATMSGALDMAAGVLQPTENARPVSFNEGRAYFQFDPVEQRLRFDQIFVSTEDGEARAEGQAYLRNFRDGWPQEFIGQFRFNGISVNPDQLYPAPVEFGAAALDFRLRLDPFTLDLGQIALDDGETRLEADGRIGVTEQGWQFGIDVSLDEISPARLIRFWPATVIPNTREWLKENILSAAIRNANFSLRMQPGEEPRPHLTFEFDAARVRYVKTLPPVDNGAGYASVSRNNFALTVEQGEVRAPNGDLLDATGTVLRIEDIHRDPPDLRVDLRAVGPVTAATSLLDLKPFELFSKAGLPTDIAEGTAEVSAEITLPLLKDLQFEDVGFSVDASLRDLSSDQLLEGRALTADRLTLVADNDGVQISGEGRIGRVPFHGRWAQAFDADQAGQSRVEGSLELSQTFLEDFRIGLPERTVSGVGRADVTIDLIRGEPPQFSLRSDLNRIALQIPDIGWSKPANATGELLVRGALGQPITVDELHIAGPGLVADGIVVLTEEGEFATAQFSNVRLGAWFNGPVTLSNRGQGLSPSVQVLGGRLDIRETTFGQGGAGSDGAQNTPITLALDRVDVSEGIAIQGFRGELSTRPGLNGTFTGRVNGQAPIRGTLVPQPNGIAVRIRSDDAGNVLRSAGVFDKVYGGEMELILVPRAENGQYNGRLTSERIKVRGASALADLLGAISVIGLLEQLNGQGIVFNSVEANFRLTPRQAIINQGSAVGASLGVSMDGVYELGSERLDMQGVISPIYVVNGIGAIFTRRGEGLFGFNYRIRGTADDPQVSVNPLSILTPGMFRDIFRRPPPEVQE